MGETGSQTVLGRIAAAGREDRQARVMTLQKAMRVTLAKVANSLMDMPLAVIGAVVQSLQGDALGGLVNDDGLLLLLDGPTAARGAVVVDQVLVGGLIQQQTIGTVCPDTGVSRRMTRTDAAICAPLLDTVFERIPEIVDNAEDARLVEGFRFGTKVDDSRSLVMMLEAPEYTVLRLTLDLARGTRQGEILLILPIQETQNSTPEEQGDREGGASKSPEMSNVVMDLKADLDMVLCRLNLSLKELQGLKPGDFLDVPAGQFPNVQIVTNAGRVVGQGAVGHVDGMRAVKPKNKQLHATPPLRRATDEELVDMPAVEEIETDRRRAPNANGNEVDARDSSPDGTAMPALRAVEAQTDEAQIARPENADAEPEIELPTLEDFPDLADLPDLNDLPDLAALPEPKLSVAS